MTAADQSRPPSIYFLIRSLNLGGAERQLVYLATRLHQRGCDVTVAVYYSGGALDAELIEAGIRFVDLGKRGRWDLFGLIFRLIGSVRRRRPDIFYSFLGSSNIFAALIRPFVPVRKFVWSIRASDMDTASYDWAVRVGYWIECLLSPAASLIISNSQAGISHAAAHGFPRRKMVLVANGIDTDRFRPDPAARGAMRRSWGLEDDQILVGLLARLDPMKDHPTFLQAVARVSAQDARFRFVCIGKGEDPYRQEMLDLAGGLGLAGRVIWAGPMARPEQALSALDICCSSSAWGEGFSNSVGEAMACGVPCAVTDVGDSASIVGDTGRVVPPGDPAALASALLEMAGMLGPRLSEAARARIVDNFSIASLVERSLAAFRPA